MVVEMDFCFQVNDINFIKYYYITAHDEKKIEIIISMFEAQFEQFLFTFTREEDFHVLEKKYRSCGKVCVNCRVYARRHWIVVDQ